MAGERRLASRKLMPIKAQRKMMFSHPVDFWIHPEREIGERRYRTFDRRGPLPGAIDPGQDAKQGRLTRSIVANNTEAIAAPRA